MLAKSVCRQTTGDVAPVAQAPAGTRIRRRLKIRRSGRPLQTCCSMTSSTVSADDVFAGARLRWAVLKRGLLPMLRTVELTMTDLGIILGTYERPGPVRQPQTRQTATHGPRLCSRRRLGSVPSFDSGMVKTPSASLSSCQEHRDEATDSPVSGSEVGWALRRLVPGVRELRLGLTGVGRGGRGVGRRRVVW